MSIGDWEFRTNQKDRITLYDLINRYRPIFWVLKPGVQLVSVPVAINRGLKQQLVRGRQLFRTANFDVLDKVL